MTKVVPYDARSLKKLGCKLLHSWGGGQTQSVIIITLFFSILMASLNLKYFHCESFAEEKHRKKKYRSRIVEFFSFIFIFLRSSRTDKTKWIDIGRRKNTSQDTIL